MKSTPEELAALRTAVIITAEGRCEWPSCSKQGEQMAHLHHRGMGGSRAANTIDNVLWLCSNHHDVLDGRLGATSLRVELNELLRVVVVNKRDIRVAPAQ